MNHIAHFLLAPQTVEGAIGTLLADFVRGPVAESLPAAVAAAVRLHRAIDGETDRISDVRALKASFAPEFRRFAGLALDLYFDHRLAREWPRYSPQPFDTFIAGVHRSLDAGLHAGYVPDRMRLFATAMRDRDWLRSYRNFEGVEAALQRLNYTFERRFRREVELRPLAGELLRLQAQCDSAFGMVFAHLQRFAELASDRDGQAGNA